VRRGSSACTVKESVDRARDRGLKVGGLRVRMFRPFPEDLLHAALAGRARVGVIDRDVSPGLGGILWSELRGTVGRDTLVQGYMTGLGGGDVRAQHIDAILEDLLARTEPGLPSIMEVA